MAEFSTQGNQIIDGSGKKVRFTGVNWGGGEHQGLVPVGLHVRNYKALVDTIANLGFNAIRMPYSDDMVTRGNYQPVNTANSTSVNYGMNPELQGKTLFQVWDAIIDYCATKNIFILLDHHRTWCGVNERGDTWSGTMKHGLWYDRVPQPNALYGKQYTEADVIANWKALATRWGNRPNIIGADVHNEPFEGRPDDGGPNGIHWGQPSTSRYNDWPAAIERIGNAIHTVAPHWLIIAEGVNEVYDPWSMETLGGSYAAWGWGSNLCGAKPGRRPIRLTKPNKLVYSVHDYPKYRPLHAIAPFNPATSKYEPLPANYPNSLIKYWDDDWGWNYTKTLGTTDIAPVIVGECGGRFDGQALGTIQQFVPQMDATRERQTVDMLMRYCNGDFNGDGARDTNLLAADDQGPSFFMWDFGPFSYDTGGILENDFTTVNQTRYQVYKPYLFTQTIVGGTGGGSTTPPPDPDTPTYPVPDPVVYQNFSGKSARITVGTSYTNVYTCPSDRTSVILSIQATNIDTVENEVKVSVQWKDASGNTTTRLAHEVVVRKSKGFTPLVVGKYVLEAGDSIEAMCGKAGAIQLSVSLNEFA